MSAASASYIPRMLPWTALLTGAIGIGFAPILAKLAVRDGHISPVAAGVWRMGIGSALFAVVAIVMLLGRAVRTQALKVAPGPFFFFGTLAGLFFAGDLATWHTSFEMTSVANASLLANVAAVIVPAGGALIFGERLTKSFYVAFFLSIVGMLLLVCGQAPNDSTSGSSLLGDLLALLTAFSYAGYMLSSKKIAASYSPLHMMCWCSAVCCVALLALCLMFDMAIVPQTPRGWQDVCLLAILSQFLGQGLVAVAIRSIKVSTVTLVLLLAPVSSCLFGYLFLAQPMTGLQMLGAAVIVSGVALVIKK